MAAKELLKNLYKYQRSFTVYRSLFTVRYPLSVFYDQCLTVNGKRIVNGKWKMVNGCAGDL